MGETCVWALEADTFSDVPPDGSFVLCGKEAAANGLCVDHLAPVLSAEIGRERDALRAQVADLTARAETAEAKVAAAWDEGHRGCTCQRPGTRPCLNPYRAAAP